MMARFTRIAFAVSLIIFGVAGCAGHPRLTPPFIKISVQPSSITVAVESMTSFTAVFSPGMPQGGSLSWSVSPANGGTITSSGVYTAPATPGNYTIVATWTPSSPAAGSVISGSAVVQVLSAPGAELNIDLIQASGGVQVLGTIQNSAVIGQIVPSVVSTNSDDNGSVQSRSGFTIPVACTPRGNPC
jgi:hypothetical protein